MTKILVWAQAFAMAVGGPGLFLVAVLDSSFLSLPEINDILVVLMVTNRKGLVLYYVAMATLGSVVGDLILYAIARKGGNAVLRKRFTDEQVQHTMRAFQRYGVVAVAVPAALPPPMPFKLVVLAAGVARMPVASFAMSVLAGRGSRYLLEGVLAYFYGAAALDYVRAHGTEVAVWLGIAIGACVAASSLWHRHQRGMLRGPEESRLD